MVSENAEKRAICLFGILQLYSTFQCCLKGFLTRCLRTNPVANDSRKRAGRSNTCGAAAHLTDVAGTVTYPDNVDRKSLK